MSVLANYLCRIHRENTSLALRGDLRSVAPPPAGRQTAVGTAEKTAERHPEHRFGADLCVFRLFHVCKDSIFHGHNRFRLYHYAIADVFTR